MLYNLGHSNSAEAGDVTDFGSNRPGYFAVFGSSMNGGKTFLYWFKQKFTANMCGFSLALAWNDVMF